MENHFLTEQITWKILLMDREQEMMGDSRAQEYSNAVWALQKQLFLLLNETN